MKEKLTAIFQKSPYGYIGFIEELPGLIHRVQLLMKQGKI